MPRPNASEQAKRLVALLGHLMSQSRIPLSVLAERVGLPESQLASDLETLSMCGVAPYDPWAMIPVMIEDGLVEVFGDMPALKGSVRLSAGEAGALVAALESAGITSEHPLARRLISAAGNRFDAEQIEQIVTTAPTSHDSDTYEAVAHGLEKRLAVGITYLSAGTDQPKERSIEPASMFVERGAWYVTAWCRAAGGWRTFRLDRIASAEVMDETFDARDFTGQCKAFTTEGLPLAVLRFAPEATVSEREWPGIRVVGKDEGGGTFAEVPYSGMEWIARMVTARLGKVEVVEPSDVRAATRRLASEALRDLVDDA